MKRLIYFMVCLFALIAFYGCGKQDTGEAGKYLSEARSLFSAGQYNEALLKADSIRIVSPKSYPVIRQAEYLTDSVLRAVYSLKVDSLIAVENEYRKNMYTETMQSDNPQQVRQYWEQRIDSIRQLKKVPLAVISEIYGKECERLASCQCVTAMRQR